MEHILINSKMQLFVFALLYALVIVLIGLDLWAGVRKAKQRNEFRSSAGFRRTLQKIAQYYNALFALTVIDVVQMVSIGMINHLGGYALLQIPFITILGTIFVGAIEVKSILEKNTDKEKAQMQEAFNLFVSIAKNHDLKEVLKTTNEYLENKKVDNVHINEK